MLYRLQEKVSQFVHRSGVEMYMIPVHNADCALNLDEFIKKDESAPADSNLIVEKMKINTVKY